MKPPTHREARGLRRVIMHVEADIACMVTADLPRAEWRALDAALAWLHEAVRGRGLPHTPKNR